MAKVFYYIGEPFEPAILWQSVIQIIVQTILLQLKLRYRITGHSSSPSSSSTTVTTKATPISSHFRPHHKETESLGIHNHNKQQYSFKSNIKSLFTFLNNKSSFLKTLRIFSKFFLFTILFIPKYFIKLFDSNISRPFKFWQWDFQNKKYYWLTIIYISIILFFLQLLFGKFPCYNHTLGLISLCLESLVPLPQILLLRHTRTADGFKLTLLGSWLSGDVSRILYLVFGATDTEDLYLFVIFATLQLGLDLYVCGQYIYYGTHKDRKSTSYNQLNGIEMDK